MTTYAERLEKELQDANEFFRQAEQREEENEYSDEGWLDGMERKYWEGYADALNNALALYYGPTPLEGGE